MNNKQLQKKELFNLIEKITPLNNAYRDLTREKESGRKILTLMWQVGDLIESFVMRHEIKPHALYWQIYGKAEGLKNSYITRDFLSYCLRIKKYFLDIKDVGRSFSNLKRYSLFREAFPLLENSKYKLSENETGKIIKILNSDMDSREIKKIIIGIKSDHIGIKNTRNQKLHEMKSVVDNFVVIYNEIYNLIKINDQKSVSNFRKFFKNKFLIKLSQGVAALTQENLYIPEFKDKLKLPDHWEEFIDNMKNLFQSSVEDRNRFRRVISPRKLFNLADMLNVITTDRGIINYRKQKNIQ